MRVLAHAGRVDLLFQLVEFALLATAQLFLDRLDLLVEVVFLLRALHLALHAALHLPVDIELFDLDVQHFGDAGEALQRVEDFQQFLLLFDI